MQRGKLFCSFFFFVKLSRCINSALKQCFLDLAYDSLVGQEINLICHNFLNNKIEQKVFRVYHMDLWQEPRTLVQY